MSKIDLNKVRDELTNIANDLNAMNGMACMADLFFAILRSKHVCVSQDYFSHLKKLFVFKNDYEKNEERHVIQLRVNRVINSKLDLVAEYIKTDNIYLIKSIESHGLTYTCDETVPRLIIN